MNISSSSSSNGESFSKRNYFQMASILCEKSTVDEFNRIIIHLGILGQIAPYDKIYTCNDDNQDQYFEVIKY